VYAAFWTDLQEEALAAREGIVKYSGREISNKFVQTLNKLNADGHEHATVLLRVQGTREGVLLGFGGSTESKRAMPLLDKKLDMPGDVRGSADGHVFVKSEMEDTTTKPDAWGLEVKEEAGQPRFVNLRLADVCHGWPSRQRHRTGLLDGKLHFIPSVLPHPGLQRPQVQILPLGLVKAVKVQRCYHCPLLAGTLNECHKHAVFNVS